MTIQKIRAGKYQYWNFIIERSEYLSASGWSCPGGFVWYLEDLEPEQPHHRYKSQFDTLKEARAWIDDEVSRRSRVRRRNKIAKDFGFSAWPSDLD
jgi:hypothetical protein